MKYYFLEGSSYEEYYKTVYMSETSYSREEFLDIIKKAYRIRCDKISQDPYVKSRCDWHLEPSHVLWRKEFDDVVESISDLKTLNADESICIGVSITPNENTRSLFKAIRSLDIPDCRDECDQYEMLKKSCCVYYED